MSIHLRITQTFEASREKEFMELEKKFMELENRRADFPKGRRFRPVSGGIPVHSLVWECGFADIQKAHQAMEFLSSDGEHQELAELQAPFFKEVRVEFFREMS